MSMDITKNRITGFANSNMSLDQKEAYLQNVEKELVEGLEKKRITQDIYDDLMSHTIRETAVLFSEKNPSEK